MADVTTPQCVLLIHTCVSTQHTLTCITSFSPTLPSHRPRCDCTGTVRDREDCHLRYLHPAAAGVPEAALPGAGAGPHQRAGPADPEGDLYPPSYSFQLSFHPCIASHVVTAPLEPFPLFLPVLPLLPSPSFLLPRSFPPSLFPLSLFPSFPPSHFAGDNCPG